VRVDLTREQTVDMRGFLVIFPTSRPEGGGRVAVPAMQPPAPSTHPTGPENPASAGNMAREGERGVKRGRPVLEEGSGLNGAARHRSLWVSDRVVISPKPGSSGGGQDL
jgi:hypothetical protein